MSFRTISSPITFCGIHIEEIQKMAVPSFLLHVGGYLPQNEKWSSGGPISSPFWCLWHVMGEGHWVESQGNRYELGPGSIMLAPSQAVYSTHNSRPAPHLYLHFSLVPQYGFEATEPISVEVNDVLRHQIAAMVATFQCDSEEKLRILCYQGTALLNTCFSLNPLPLRVLPDELRAILAHIENSPADDLSNIALAREVCVSANTFIAWFEKHMNRSPAAYVRQVRHSKASKLLAFSNLSIEEIATQTGYGNRHYFSRAFARETGVGPATFRKRHRDYHALAAIEQALEDVSDLD